MQSLRRAILCAAMAFSLAAPCVLAGCGASGSGGGGASGAGETSGAAFSPLTPMPISVFTGVTEGTPSAGIDTSGLVSGYVGAVGQSSSRLKFQVACGEETIYDMPSDGTPIIAPLSFGNGTYTFSILENTSGNRYVELFTTTQTVNMSDESAPFVRPNVFCNYNEGSAVVGKARELASGAENEGDVLAAVYGYIVDNVTYDTDKAAQLADQSGYIPDPDETLATGKGICSDYASLMAAMLRSQNIPCQIVVGYVMPDNIYHAWNMVRIDGSWKAVAFTVNPDTWTRLDATFASSGDFDPNSVTYTDRHVY